MKQVCRLCKTELDNGQISDYFITNGICSPCSSNFLQNASSLNKFLDGFEVPILMMQSDPRQVRTANKKACGLFNKELSQIEGSKGGQVLGCVHSCTEAGCGLDINCEDCKIKNAVVETFMTGKSFKGVSTSLQINKNAEVAPYTLEISTEKVGDFALVRIDQYRKEPGTPQ